MNTINITDILSRNLTEKLFSPEFQLVPNINEIYELELAFYENQILSDEELLQNGAYFARIGNKYTRHFKMCVGESLKLPAHSSSRLKSFFEKNLFRTGYATHGLFPYRGKFHPQMIKGLMNIMGIKPGHTVLDPMMGSGTVLVEASLMGIHSIGIDISPFCRLMTQTKLDALTMSLIRARKTLNNYKEVFDYFKNKVGVPGLENKTTNRKMSGDALSAMEEAAEYNTKQIQGSLTKQQKETSDTYNFLLLAYLDSAGYSERSQRKDPLDQFKAILERYIFVAEKIQKVLTSTETKLATSRVIEADARSLPVEDSTVDGIIFSPPYSFAIDYIENDSFHLKFLGVEIENLRDKMIGLRGRNFSEKFTLYKMDMEKILSECSRVLHLGKLCTIIVGTNDNQLGKALKMSPGEVPGLHEVLIEMGLKFDFKLIKMMSRSILGISNTMRREYIVILQKI
jgi:DNA modification methylase